MKPVEIQEKLQLTKFKDRDWYVQPSCATEGDGLYEGLSWLSQTHSGGGKKKWRNTASEYMQGLGVIVRASSIKELAMHYLCENNLYLHNTCKHTLTYIEIVLN